jgi:hypothetical protein
MTKTTLNSSQIAAIKRHAEVMNGIYDAMAKRGEVLHDGQVRVAKDIFVDRKRVVQAQWGRKAGKTLCACFIAWAYALLNDNAEVWIICPQRKQGKDIYWVSGRLQNFGPQEFVEQHKESEITVQFKNGSLIRIDGCENYPALRGINPSLVIYDEFQDHSKEFHVEVMAPNLIAKKAALVVIGTPPKRETYYVEFRNQLLQEIKDGDTTRSYYEFPSEINPSLDKVELEKTRVRLYKAGDEKIWLREHMAQLIYGGEGAVFSPWSRERHIRHHKVLTASIEKDRKGMKWYTVFDPGSSTCFAVLFAAYNQYTSQLFLLDEIYETNQRCTDCGSIWNRAMAKEKELYPGAEPHSFHRVYDEAAEWFHVNIQKMYPQNCLTPCVKNKQHGYSSKEADCSLIKQIMSGDNTFFVSDRCAKFAWEVENYVLDDNGNYPKDHDHLLDSLTYLLKACNYKFIEAAAPTEGINGTYVKGIYGNMRMRQGVEPAEAMDNVVDDSLWIDGHDIYSEYIN